MFRWRANCAMPQKKRASTPSRERKRAPTPARSSAARAPTVSQRDVATAPEKGGALVEGKLLAVGAPKPCGCVMATWLWFILLASVGALAFTGLLLEEDGGGVDVPGLAIHERPPLFPLSTVAVLQLASLRETYKQLSALGALPPPFPATLDEYGSFLAGALGFAPPDFGAPFSASFILHAGADLCSPYAGGEPRPAVLLQLPGVEVERLFAHFPVLRPSSDSPTQFTAAWPYQWLKVSTGSRGSVGLLALGAHFYDLSAPACATLPLPNAAAAAMRAAAVSLALVAPKFTALLDAAQHLLGPLRGALDPIFWLPRVELLEALRGMNAAVLAARWEGASGLRAGLHTIFEEGRAVQHPTTSADLWPDLPARNDALDIMAAFGDAPSPHAVADADARARRALLNFTPPTALYNDARSAGVAIFHSVNGMLDGAQLALVDNGAGDPTHPNCPPHLPEGAEAWFPPGFVAILAKGGALGSAWRAQEELVNGLRVLVRLLAESPGAPPTPPFTISNSTSSTRVIGGVAFESRRVLVTFQGSRSWLAGKPRPQQLVLDVAAGAVGGKTLLFGALSDAGVLPFVEAARSFRGGAFSSQPEVGAAFSRLPKKRSHVAAYWLAPLLRYLHGFRRRSGAPQWSQREAELVAKLEAEGALLGFTTVDKGAVVSNEAHFDLAPYLRRDADAPKSRASSDAAEL